MADFDVPLFEQVAEAVRSLVPEELGALRSRAHRRGVKVWFGAEKPPRQHYEAQVIPRRYVDGVEGMAVEVGFHAEHREPDRNVQVLETLTGKEKSWRKVLGKEADSGIFFGADDWRRVSEAWIEPDLDDPDMAFEIAARLVDYLAALEPILSADGSDA